MKACLMVRATVHDDSRREATDHWYEATHLPAARQAFSASAAWRGWSPLDEAVHYYAFCEFDDAARAQAVLDSDALKALVADFDATWGDAVSCTREIINLAQRL